MFGIETFSPRIDAEVVGVGLGGGVEGGGW